MDWCSIWRDDMRLRKGSRHTMALEAEAILDNSKLDHPNLQTPCHLRLFPERGSVDGSRTKRLIFQYVEHKKRQTRMGVLLLIACIAVCLCLTLLLSLPVAIEWLALFLALILLSAAKQWMLSYRVGKGWFCNNEYEASELLRFFDKNFSADWCFPSKEHQKT